MGVLTATAATVVGAYDIESFAEPNQRIELAANEPGVLNALPVREGDAVREGQVVAMLDLEVLEAQRDVLAARAAATGAIASAEAELRLRQLRLDALRELDARGHASPSELRRAEADLSIAQAGVVDVESILIFVAFQPYSQQGILRVRHAVYASPPGVFRLVVRRHRSQEPKC